MLTERKCIKTVRPGDCCLNRETPGKSRRLGRYEPVCIDGASISERVGRREGHRFNTGLCTLERTLYLRTHEVMGTLKKIVS